MDALEKLWDDALGGMETIHVLPAWRAAMEGFFAAFRNAAYTLETWSSPAIGWPGHWRETQQGEWQEIADVIRGV